MRILIFGADGYLGYSLWQYAKSLGHTVDGCDNGLRRKLVADVGSESLIPIQSMEERGIRFGDVTNYETVSNLVKEFQPDAIVHLAQIPSAPYSMKNQETAVHTQTNNIVGTMNILWAMKEFAPQSHLVKLGTMGEYGYDNAVIKETPDYIMNPGSFYHASKCFDSLNIKFTARTWKLRATDLNQGIVWGHYPGTRLDYDSVFGTVLNRFVVQGLRSVPLTVYGSGQQKRGYIYINNSLECIMMSITNPPERGEYRVFNQLTEIFSINELTDIVRKGCHRKNLKVTHLDNPRTEVELHKYKPVADRLRFLGLRPVHMFSRIDRVVKEIEPYTINAKLSLIEPTIKWA